jgi:hypothetical protein
MGVNEDAFSRSDFPGRKVGWFNQRFDGVEVGDDDTGDGDDVMVMLFFLWVINEWGIFAPLRTIKKCGH